MMKLLLHREQSVGVGAAIMAWRIGAAIMAWRIGFGVYFMSVGDLVFIMPYSIDSPFTNLRPMPRLTDFDDPQPQV